MDRQEAKLRAELQGTGVQVQRDGNNLTLIMPGNITFASSSADIRSDFFDVLNSVAKVLAEFNQTSIRITGHTDSTGGDKINIPLSERRADSVAMYLRSQKVNGARIQSYGYGSRYPIASNDTPAGREQNRRVELELIPNE
jgi:outer membrane protein OmpA-like peptidoglycan-associated protein